MARAFAFDLGGVLVDVDKSGLYRLHTDRRLVEAAFFGGAHDAMSVGTLSAGAFLDQARAVLGAAADDDAVAAAWSGVVRFSAGGLALLAEVAAATRVLVWSNTDPLLHFGVLPLPSRPRNVTSWSPSPSAP